MGWKGKQVRCSCRRVWLPLTMGRNKMAFAGIPTPHCMRFGEPLTVTVRSYAQSVPPTAFACGLAPRRLWPVYPLVSLTSEFAHAPLSVSVKLCFFLAPKVTKRKEFPAVLSTAQRMRGGFNASNPSWVKHRRMHRCVVATPPFFFYSTTP